jgi:cell division protein YceG involved in septum cleavage
VSARRNSGRRVGRMLLVFALLLAILAGSAAALLRWDWESMYAGYAPGGVFVEIPHGMAVAAIARLLEANGVVRSALSFRLLALRNRRERLEAGEYHFDQLETPEQVLDTLARGRIYLVSVTLPEGETMFGIADLLAAKGRA